MSHPATQAPASPIDAAMAAAWPGLPEGMTLEEARRRTVRALNAAYPHLVPASDVQAVVSRLVEFAERPGIDEEQRRILRGAVRVARGENL